jgi:serpin B
MEVPFGAGADFSGMLPGVWIDQAVHRANITVDEWGSEAAAVTGLGFAVSAPPPPDVTIRADHPFAFAIVDTNTRTPLFIGHVADPTATD